VKNVKDHLRNGAMELGSDSSVSKKDAKLGFVVNYTNLLLIPGLCGRKDLKMLVVNLINIDLGSGLEMN
jgi:hypothetical protein